MATTFAKAIEHVIALAEAHCQNVTVLRCEERSDVCVLELNADYGRYQLHLREIWRVDGSRKYAYYLLAGTTVLTGFDNAADPRALSLKYGKDYAQRRLEAIPHQHTAGKQTLVLTAEMDCAALFVWLQENLGATTNNE